MHGTTTIVVTPAEPELADAFTAITDTTEVTCVQVHVLYSEETT